MEDCKIFPFTPGIDINPSFVDNLCPSVPDQKPTPTLFLYRLNVYNVQKPISRSKTLQVGIKRVVTCNQRIYAFDYGYVP